MTKRLINILILLFGIIFVFWTVNYNNYDCLFHHLFGIYCPSCGLTHGFREILNLNILEAIECNLLSPILFLFVIYSTVHLFIDIIINKNTYLINLNKLLSKHYIVIIIIIVIITIVNNIK